MRKTVYYGICMGLWVLTACHSSYSIRSVEGGRVAMTDAFDVNQDMASWRILQAYQTRIDSMMSPVIGHSAQKLEVRRPESPLSNLLADILRRSAEEKTGIRADVGVMNMGGIRNLLDEGEITVRDIFEISPFENSLSVVTLSGESLIELFKQMASVHGEGISGAKLVISAQGELLSAEVDGKPIDAEKNYVVATIDYLAEGNDRMEAFRQAIERVEPADATLRSLFIDYVKRCEQAGQWVDAKVEGRIIIR